MLFRSDASVPFFERGYWYYTRFETGRDYAINARRAGRSHQGAGDRNNERRGEHANNDVSERKPSDTLIR